MTAENKAITDLDAASTLDGTEETVVVQGGDTVRSTVQAEANVLLLGAVFTGALGTSLNSAPADGTLSAGQCVMWFDKTNGAAKLMFKAKQADGTVKTGSVNVQT